MPRLVVTGRMRRAAIRQGMNMGAPRALVDVRPATCGDLSSGLGNLDRRCQVVSKSGSYDRASVAYDGAQGDAGNIRSDSGGGPAVNPFPTVVLRHELPD